MRFDTASRTNAQTRSPSAGLKPSTAYQLFCGDTADTNAMRLLTQTQQTSYDDTTVALGGAYWYTRPADQKAA